MRPDKPGFYWVEIDGWTEQPEAEVPAEWGMRKFGRIVVCVRVDRNDIPSGELSAWVYKMDYAEPLPLFEGNYNAVWLGEANSPAPA